jgi:hypothetical protein
MQVLDSEIDLGGDGAGWDSLGCGVFPEIAHEAAPRTLAVGQENRGDGHNRARLGTFLLDKECVRPPGIDLIARTAARLNPLPVS